jgi:hypothetical protein
MTACNSSDQASSASALDTGEVALLITDAPTSAYDEINVEAEQVSLIGEGQGHEAHLMSRSARFNLLDLRNTFRRLSKCKAPVGTYSKVRFRIKNVELVKYKWDPDKLEHIRESVIPRLERNMIDLNARTQFAVDRLRKLVVKLDLDADASLGTDPDTGEPVFDPDATVETDEVPTDTDSPPQEVTPVLMNELGELRNPQTDSFQLCTTNPDGAVDCVQVNISPDTVVMNFDQYGELQVVGIGDIAENQTVQVFGHLDVATDTINALRVLQWSTRLKTYTGTLSGDVVNDSINFTITAGASADSSYPVSPVSLSGIYDSAGNVLDASALVDIDGNPVPVEVIGILNTFPTPGLQPGVIILSDQQ